MVKAIIYGVFFISIIVPFFSIIIFSVLPNYIRYRKSEYKNESKNSFLKTILDKGNYGEFITFTYLEKLDFYKRIMTNLYLPKADGTTTEIDLIMITFTGMYVFESKNYSGWIYGDEKHKNWTQTLENNKKNQFYNPIWQNKGHIKALNNVLGIDNDSVYKSIIVFSERCKLKNINVTNPDVRVIKRDLLIDNINKNQEGFNKVLSIDEIERYYLKLQEFTCVDEATKQAHIRNINKGKSDI